MKENHKFKKEYIVSVSRFVCKHGPSKDSRFNVFNTDTNIDLSNRNDKFDESDNVNISATNDVK